MTKLWVIIFVHSTGFYFSNSVYEIFEYGSTTIISAIAFGVSVGTGFLYIATKDNHN